MNTTVITIGDEILIGQVIDTNSAWIGKILNEYGFRIREILSVSDEMNEIIYALSRAAERSDLILMTGGLGPTKDDITKKALAQYLNVGMEFHQETHDRIHEIFTRRKIAFTEAHEEQCFMPIGAEILPNDVGTAPGMLFKLGKCILISMPGVPHEMMHLMERHVIPLLTKIAIGPAVRHLTVRTLGMGESQIASLLENVETNLRKEIKMAYLPDLGMVRLRFSATGLEESECDLEFANIQNEVSQIIGHSIYAYGDTTLELSIAELLLSKNMKLGTCESCTGGFLAHRITANPGSSAYFMGSIVSYDNAIKHKLLGVTDEIFEREGAVSQACVEQMVRGGLNQLNADIIVAVSGVAGPTGGSAEKPIGTVWIAVGTKDKVVSEKFLFTKDRLRNIQYASAYGLVMLWRFLKDYKL